MDLITILLTMAGLCAFEVINSIDNAVINAEILSTMQEKYRKFFLFAGILVAVFVVRGMLPWIIVWASSLSIGPAAAFSASFSDNPQVTEIIKHSSPVLLAGAATFLLILFLQWLFLEPKYDTSRSEKFFESNQRLFVIVVIIILMLLMIFTFEKDIRMFFGVIVGSAAFYLINLARIAAEKRKGMLNQANISDLGKIFYLEAIDASFSIDGVTGAFAFTSSIPLILAGNGIGALIVRQITVKNIKAIKKYRYLKKGAMYSILSIVFVMLIKSFGYDVPEWIPPAITFAIVGYFFYLSRRNLGKMRFR